MVGRDRHDRQPRETDEIEPLEGGIGFDLGQRDGPRQRLRGADLDDDDLRILLGRIGNGRRAHARETHDALLLPRVVDHDLVARRQAPHVAQRDAVSDAVPNALPLPFEVMEAVVVRFGLEKPIGHRASSAAAAAPLVAVF